MSGAGADGSLAVNPMFVRGGETASVPKHRLPDGPMDPETAHQIVRNGTGREIADLLLDDVSQLLSRVRTQSAPARGVEAASFDHASAHRRKA
jgi:glutamate decarboxylase